MTNLFTELFAADPQRPCIATLDFLGDGADGPEFTHTSHTYGSLSNRALKLGRALIDFGVAPGDRVIAQIPKSVDGYALWLGALAIGAVWVPTNTAYTPTEIAYFANDADARLLVSDDPDRLVDVPRPAVSLTELATAADTADPASIAKRSDNELCALVYTSGTTGRPKGAALTHACVLDNGRALADVWDYRHDDVLVHALPLFHVHGLFISLHPTLLSGAQVRLLPTFDIGAVLGALPGSSVFMGVPTYYHRLLSDERFGPESCESMRLFTSGSAPMTEQVHAEFTERTGRRIVERYGMSEAGIITSNRIGDEVAGSVGHALPGYEVRVTDDQRVPVEAGTTGGVEVRGPSLCRGYWLRPDADAESRTDDGWFATGDVGVLDATGRLTLEGRQSDMIISGGLNVYPKEIEMALDDLDGVIESAVVGVADADLGEAVTAYLVLEPGVGLDDLPLAEALAPLARFKHPKAFRPIDELPRNAMGKVQKVELRS